ncbi:MAG: TcpQ domain-containing protein, partial [Bdellovibrionales bacterium]
EAKEVPSKAMAEKPLKELPLEEAPLEIVESVEVSEPAESEEVLESSLDQILDADEPEIVEKVNLDIPEEIASYKAPSSDENVFEIVMSEREPVRVLDTKKVMTFHAKSGQTVKGTLEKWSDEANVQLYWETPYDFPVEKSVALTATYPMAVQALVGRYEDIDPRPTIKLHPNWPHGPSILTVK